MDIKKSKIGLARTVRSYCNERDAAKVGCWKLLGYGRFIQCLTTFAFKAKIDGLSQAGGELNTHIEQMRLQIEKINSELMSLSYEHRNAMEKQRSVAEQLNRLFASKEPKVGSRVLHSN